VREKRKEKSAGIAGIGLKSIDNKLVAKIFNLPELDK